MPFSILIDSKACLMMTNFFWAYCAINQTLLVCRSCLDETRWLICRTPFLFREMGRFSRRRECNKGRRMSKKIALPCMLEEGVW